MFDFLHRNRLVKKGMACDKRRRQFSPAAWIEFLDTGLAPKIALWILVALILSVISFWGDQALEDERLAVMLILIIHATSIMLMRLNEGSLYERNSRQLLFFGAVLSNLVITKSLVLYSNSEAGLFDTPLALYLVPSAFAPMLVGVLLGVGPGVLAAIFTSLFSAVLLAANFSVLLVVGLVTGLMAVILTQNIRKRGQLIEAGFYIGMVSLLCALCIGFMMGSDFAALMRQAFWAAAVGMVTGIIVNAVLPILEYLFQITTGVSWLESADLNHPLLRRLTIEAPGTYHHSLVVANLAEDAAQAIKADALQCRVQAYFHDIGKVEKAEYFCENQAAEENPHDDLAPSMSALIVVSHVKEGVDLALKYKLNPRIIDAIREHHGTSNVSFFLARAHQQQKDALAGVKIMNLREGDVPEVAEENFRYPGPKPQSRETAILMLADAVESASRSLQKPSPQRIEEMVAGIVRSRIESGQLDECPLSFLELRKVEERLVFTMKTMMHSRIAYPKEEEEDEEEHDSPATPQPAKRETPAARPVVRVA